MSSHASMNRIYRLVWSECLRAWVAVAENARSRGKRSRAVLVALLIGVVSGFVLPAQAAPPAPTQLPTGAQVAAGTLAINQSEASGSARMDITQSSARGVIDWQTFDIGAQAQVTFHQPSSSAVTLNRVQGSQPSQIFGRLSANGQVFLTNPAGVYFSPSASVDVGALLATTHAISNADFMAGHSSFSRDGATGSVVNDGSLNAGWGGYVALLAPEVRNRGVIMAQAGTVALAAGDVIELQFDAKNTLAGLRVSPSTVAALVENRLAVQAPGGRILLSAQAADQLQGGVVRNSGTLAASSMVADGGVIRLVGDAVQLEAGSTAKGSDIGISARRVLQSGSLDASGVAGGQVSIAASDQILQTTLASTTADGSAGDGGRISLQAGHTLYSSGSVSAQGQRGGTIHALGDNVVLAAATLDASGTQGGGTVLVGGDFQGKNADIVNASTVYVNPHTQIHADAKDSGDGGKAVVWADGLSTFYGTVTAKGGPQAGNGGQIEVSGKQELVYGGAADASAPHGTPGSLLLDPANLVISSAGSLPAYSFIDPNATVGGEFGFNIIPLSSGNVIVTANKDTVGGVATAGAVYLYNGLTGGLVSALTGSTSGDIVNGGISVLTNGNFVVRSPFWDNGASVDAGAVTWGSGLTGVSGTISSANSLVGTTAYDRVGIRGVTVLTNGNYVVSSYLWGNTGAPNAGAVTWGNGSTGIVGPVSAANSLVGTTAGDWVGIDGAIALPSGNYVVLSDSWSNAGVFNAGAVTWGNGSTGISGPVSAANSLVGSKFGDFVGDMGITVLANGNYVVRSSRWDNGFTANNAGAVTWGSGTAGVTGAVSAANSLVGSTSGDQIGFSGIIALPSGNYVVSSYIWDNGAIADAGAVTWGNGATGITGAISSANSLVGSTAGDKISSFGITVLTNGNYVVRSPDWDSGGVTNAGAVTWGSGTSGISGAVSSSNSLVGSSTSDEVGKGGIRPLTNGNYVVSNPYWNNGAVVDAGAATWGDGTTGITGVISSANSLVGTTAGDMVSSAGMTALANGNYVIGSTLWDNGALADAGAVTWGSGTAGVTGAVSSANSLVGSAGNDYVGGTVVALPSGNYLAVSSSWDNGAAVNGGAVTWADGTTGITGTITSANSLVGTSTGDQAGSHGITVLTNGNYVVRSPTWSNAGVADAGAVTWGSGASGITGPVSTSNSLVGTTTGDRIGQSGATALANGNYVVASHLWDNGTVADAGAVTWGNGATGTTGVVSSANSLVGSSASDQVAGVLALSDGNYLVRSGAWDNGALANAGALTWGSGTTGVTGVIQASNSLLGTTANQRPGTYFAEDVVNKTFVVGDSAGLTVQAGFANPNLITYARAGSSSLTVTPGLITNTLDSGTAVTLQATNNITVDSAITATGNGALTLQAGGSITVNAPIAILGALSLQATGATSDITLNAALSSAAAGDSIVLAAGRNFINNAGASALDPGAGRFLVYSTDPAADTRGGLAYDFKQYNAAFGDPVLGSGNGLLYTLAPTLTPSLSGSVSKVYDGTTTATLAAANYSVSGTLDGDTVTLNNPAGTYDTKDAGSGKTVDVSGLSIAGASNGSATVYGYQLAATTASAAVGDITPKTLTVIGMTAAGRVYDGTTQVALSGGSLSGLVGTETLSFSGQTGTLADKNVGSAKPVTVTGITLADAGSGATAGLASNYSISHPSSLTADITPKTLTVSATGTDKVYDGTAVANVTLGDDRVAGDVLTLSGTASFADKNVGTAKPVSVTGISLTGTDAANYSLAATTASTSADITPRSLTITAGGIDKVYDGTTTATVTLDDDRVAGDVLTLSHTAASFADKNVGTAKPVSVSGISITGTDAANYSVNTTASTTADITPRSLTITAGGIDKVYDGTPTASVTLGDDRVAGDVLTLSNTSAAFADKNVGTAKPVSVIGISVTGTDAANYSVNTTASTTADITPRSLTITAGGIDKVYDGTTTAKVTLADDRVAGDVLTLSGTASFADPDVGTAKPVSVIGIAVAGTDAGNYALASTTAGTLADITLAAVAPSVSTTSPPSAAPPLLTPSLNPSTPAASPGAGDPANSATAPAPTAPSVTAPQPAVVVRVPAVVTRMPPPLQPVHPLGRLLARVFAAEPAELVADASLPRTQTSVQPTAQDDWPAPGAINPKVLRASLAKVWRELDGLHQQGQVHFAQRQQLILSITGGAVIVSVGYVLWLLVGGTLTSLALALLPLWRGLDPLPVLAQRRKPKPNERADDEDSAAEERIRALLGAGERGAAA